MASAKYFAPARQKKSTTAASKRKARTEELPVIRKARSVDKALKRPKLAQDSEGISPKNARQRDAREKPRAKKSSRKLRAKGAVAKTRAKKASAKGKAAKALAKGRAGKSREANAPAKRDRRAPLTEPLLNDRGGAGGGGRPSKPKTGGHPIIV
ncbi:MAG TPA: hypothetical protein VNI54_12885 [Thermoanaerobaculia bacterium]|nr:hypothetical protein [Thermoanaerobaculia bacterium]